MADTPNGETVNPGDTQTSVQTAAPVVTGNVVDPAEVERLRKEQEQKDLRIRQLENEAEARKKADEAAEAKRLEDNQEYKTLAEQEREKRIAAEKAFEEREAREELATAKADAQKDFPDEVKTQAKELGIDLNSSDEASVAAYKDKLTKLNTAFSSNGRVTSNNGRQTTSTRDTHTLLQDYAKGDQGAIEEALNKVPWIADHTQQQ